MIGCAFPHEVWWEVSKCFVSAYPPNVARLNRIGKANDKPTPF